MRRRARTSWTRELCDRGRESGPRRRAAAQVPWMSAMIVPSCASHAANTARTEPRPLMRTSITSPGATVTIGPSAPVMMTSPGLERRADLDHRAREPQRCVQRVAQAGRAGADRNRLAAALHRHAAQPQIERRRTSSARPPSTKRPDEALSATVSSSLMFQFSMRLPTISIAGRAYADGRDRPPRASPRAAVEITSRARARSRPRPSAA